jgi:predicted amidohydrolase
MRLHVFQGGFVDGVERNLALLAQVVEAECTQPNGFVPSSVLTRALLSDADLRAQGATAAAASAAVMQAASTQRGADKIVPVEAKMGRPDLIVFPELFVCGYVVGEALRSLGEPKDGPSFARISAVAARFQVGIVYGYCERDPLNGRLYNSAQFVDKNGRSIANYRKTHLYSDYEKKYFAPGDSLGKPVDFMGLRVALLICFDIEFPEPIRALALQGVDLVLVPTANTCPIQNLITVPSRAVENLCFVAYVNRAGIEDCAELGKPLAFSGVSVISGPDGLALAQGGFGIEVLRCTIDPSLSRYERARTAAPYFKDRRPELYATSSIPSNL